MKYNQGSTADGMPRKKSSGRKKRKKVGIEAIVEPGVGALYVRGRWIEKLKDLDKRRPKQKRGKQ